MTKTSKTILFFGNERLATGVSTSAPTLRALIAAGYHVAAVVSHHDSGQSRKPRPLEIQAVAEAHGIPVLLPNKPGDIADQLAAYQAEAAVLVAYGRIVPDTIIDLFPRGIINIHPSLLPLHRGPTPIESAMLQGEVTGVSLMRLVSAMDAGPVYASATGVPTEGRSKAELAEELLSRGAELLITHLPGILDGSLSAEPQDETQATFDSRLSKQAGRIDWQKPATVLAREIKAYAGWPKSTTDLAGKPVIILAASPSDETGAAGVISQRRDQLLVGCGIGSLHITQLMPAGKAAMSGTAFLAGYVR